MSGKVPNYRSAYGYWGRSTYKRVQAEQTSGKIRALLQDKLLTRGVPAWLYLPVTATTPGVATCTCVKDTNRANDRPCNECYGIGLVPGYTRAMHETVFFGASEVGTFTLASTFVDQRIKPHRILLSAGATSGTIETPDKTYTNTDSDAWETGLDAFIRDSGNTVTAEFSTDFGGTWTDVADINTTNTPVGSGSIRFRITLTRAAATDRSPAFEIIRARHVNSGAYNETHILDVREGVSRGQILVLRPWIQEQAQSDTGRGLTVDWMGDRSWTMPLDFFDTTVTADTPAARISDQKAGPHPFYEYASGIKTGDRVVMTSFKYNEEFGIFTHQSFDERKAQPNEDPYGIVF